MEKKKNYYKYAIGPNAIEALEQNNGNNLKDFIPSTQMFYMPYNGGMIEYCWRDSSEGKYIRSCGKMVKKKEILDDVERKYLSNVCRPFMDKITSIIKTAASSSSHTHEFIKIDYLDNNYRTYTMSFPNFTKSTMYKGMELDKIYTPKDLNLK